ncbi:MAG: type III PLP-dependent enzyme [Myxococcota bacterium]
MPISPIERFESVRSLIDRLQPEDPVFCIRPHRIQEAALAFQSGFPGTTLYAVKCNPHPRVIQTLVECGIRHFDVASLAEIELLRGLVPEASLYFMHPVKDRRAIREAYRGFGVRSFVVDHPDELEKLFSETGSTDLLVFVRVETPKASNVLYHLSSKFGAPPDEAAELLRLARSRGARTALTFHVGSQCLDPKAYRIAFEQLAEVIRQSGQEPACIDVGGGFPHAYPGVEVPPFEAYVAEIHAGLRDLPLATSPPLLAEPGRALVAGGASLLAQVKLRKNDRLYINDGVYGAFSELIDSEYELPARRIAASAARDESSPAPGELLPFEIHGPTCDSMDVFAAPLRLPADTAEGDWLEIDGVGAYSNALSTHFNGFGLDRFAEVGDEDVDSS